MDREDALHERRAAHRRRIRRRRRLTASAVLACGVLVAIAAASGALRGRSEPESSAGAAATSTRPASSARPGRAARPSVPQPPGLHRAPHEPVPILMFHVIGYRKPNTPNPTLWVSPHAFHGYVTAMRRSGYNGVTLQQVWNAWHHRGELPRRPVVLSFDDGYYGQYAHAMPELKRAGWPGVLNLKLGNLADMGGAPSIRRMIAAGWEVDSHTFTHPDLTTLPAAALRHEVAGSRSRLHRLFGVAVNFFCYPAGRYDDAVIAAVKRAGYLAATTVQPGWSQPGANRFTLQRVRIDGGTSTQDVLARLRELRPASAGAGT